MEPRIDWPRNDYSRVPFRLHHDPELYELEMERIFRGPTWNYLALEAELEIAGPRGRRTVRADQFFVDLFQTAIGPDEILCEIRVTRTPKSVAYEKTEQKASGFALVGIAVVVDGRGARVGVTGVAAKAYRASRVEQALATDRSLTPERIARAAAHAADGVEPLSDIHASASFRAHLAEVNTRRALTRALGLA